ncbi:tail fiber assembly protein [Enterobacter cancerogenus]|uniref:tail fiber assembly protein n=1 Tax=Enterobacter cancerogenus TaxID=69218 RepID=UPI00187D4A53|nr:tail fiber assembly protein [Enterobacter cancerogenus]
MKIYTNFKQYSPETNNLPDLNIGYLICDEGIDWYECQNDFSSNTIKIGFDASGIIRTYANDVSMLWPVGFSVTEVALTELPEGFNILGEWFFNGEEIVPREYTDEEVRVQNEIKKQNLMALASTAIAPLQDAVDIGEATDIELSLLARWKSYRIKLNRMRSGEAWPVPPVS